MQTVQLNIQLDISRDILDKVMFLLDNLPKNKVKLKVMNNVFAPYNKKSRTDTFFNTLRNRNLKIDKNINIDNIMNEMNNGLS
jgi:hypothetical protein